MRARQIVLLNLIIIIVVVLALVGGYVYFYNQNNYISETDAYVDVNAQYIVSTVPGKLTKWTVQDGGTVTQGVVLGVEQLPTGQTLNITSPVDGQVLKTTAVQGEVVSAGMTLGVVANLDNEYIQANVKESDIRNVKVGQAVDVYIDAYPGQTFSGIVESVDAESAANASAFPSSTSTGTSKEVQRIPVKISLLEKNGKYIIPHMNASVRIHRNS